MLCSNLGKASVMLASRSVAVLLHLQATAFLTLMLCTLAPQHTP
jgi:hypothetical protein